MRQVIVGAVLLVAGVALISTGYRDALRDTDYASNLGITVLRDDPGRTAFPGNTEDPEFISTGVLVLGAVSALAGAGMLVYHWLGTPVAGEFPRFHWTRERHGGA